MPFPDQLKVWPNKLKENKILTYIWLLRWKDNFCSRCHFCLNYLKTSISICCYFAQVSCKTLFLLFAPELKHNTMLFRNKFQVSVPCPRELKTSGYTNKSFYTSTSKVSREGNYFCLPDTSHRKAGSVSICTHLYFADSNTDGPKIWNSTGYKNAK